MAKFQVGDKIIIKHSSVKKVFEIVGMVGSEQDFPEYYISPLDSTKDAIMVMEEDEMQKIEGNEELIRILYG